MRCGVTMPAFADWSDPRTVMEMALEAERAGWDGFFLWDHVTWNPAWGGTPAMADPWICLAAAAAATSRVTVGPMVTPLARRRPQIVAREIVSLDHLAGGRAVLGVGLGDDFEYQVFGEPLQGRAARLDEALSVIETLLSGAPVDFEGEHFHVHSPPALPRPVNETIPVWVGGHWPNPGPFRRAARYDGVIPRRRDHDHGGYITVDDLAAIRTAIGRGAGFDYVVSGSTASPTDVAALRAWEAAGATWWLESLHPFAGAAAGMRGRLRAGPPIL